MREFTAIGERVKAELKRQNKTQSWLSDETGIQRGYLSELINGHPKKRWNEDNIEKVSRALGVSIIGGDTKEQRLNAFLDSAAQDFKDDPFISPLLQSLDAAIKERNKK